MTELVDFEVELLRSMAGQIPAKPWGAAVGACLESLSGFGMVAQTGGRWYVTNAGHAELAKRGYSSAEA